MERTCTECGKSFAHASSYSRHRKVCGTASTKLSCPNCTSTFTRASNLKRHVERTCKGKKRFAEEELPESPPEKVRLVDYESSDEEPLSQTMAEPMGPWRSEEQPSDEEEPSRSSDTESEEVANPIEHWRALSESEETSEEESSDSEDDAESLDNESSDEWHTAEEEVPEEQVLSLETLRKALPWAEYQGISADQFGGATQRIEGNPL